MRGWRERMREKSSDTVVGQRFGLLMSDGAEVNVRFKL
jgi:hypothetical protein